MPCKLLTVGEAKMWHERFMEAGGEGTGKDYQNMVHEILLQYDDDVYIIDIVNFPELHVMMGVTQRLLDYIKAASYDKWVEDIIVEMGYWTQFELVFLENISQNFLENNRSLFSRKF